MSDDTEGPAGDSREPNADLDSELNAEMRAINERLVIAAVRQQTLAETASKKAESALQSVALYRLMAQNFPNGMVLLFDHDLRHILADGGGLVTLGLSKAILEGRTIWEEFSPQTCRHVEPAYRAALAGETMVSEVPFPAGASFPERGERVYQICTLPIRDEQGNVMTGMAVAQDVTEQRQVQAIDRWQARHDPLTGLPNRALLRDRLDQVLAMCERAGTLSALLFLDLDGFKQINDTWGHAVGDSLLQAVAGRLTSCLRAEDTVARFGGDEFVVLLPKIEAAEDAAGVARTITTLLARPLLIDGHEISVTVSVGVSLFPADGRDVDALFASADTAMYACKTRQRQDEKSNKKKRIEG